MSYFNPRRISNASTFGSEPRKSIYCFITSRLPPRERTVCLNFPPIWVESSLFVACRRRHLRLGLRSTYRRNNRQNSHRQRCVRNRCFGSEGGLGRSQRHICQYFGFKTNNIRNVFVSSHGVPTQVKQCSCKVFKRLVAFVELARDDALFEAVLSVVLLVL